ncbi:TPA: ead/Ea22-like family protein [Klebsiella pneumoniae subsp. pneumoniae]|nr:ead/Ea22-like family protein [Klebsiella pneumoniae]HDT5013682.1 ead/Ea22-like family protein [Klebsiella pneumoniae subsp. pneumoniae]HEO9334625.1 ead/Ea22-like family protein [Klebsiella pneumoniae subsp. pneumoniae]
MTDITELAQRMKTAAEKLDADQWQTRKGFSGIEVIVKGSLEKGHGCVSFQPVAADMADTKTARAIALFSPANVLALVEALEKAQAQSSKWLEAYHKAVSIGARYEERIAELESRTVTVKQGEVLVTVAGFTGCGKSAIAGEIEIAMKAIGVPVTWANGDSEKRMTGADWLIAIEMYKPTVRIVEVNIPRAAGIKVEAE